MKRVIDTSEILGTVDTPDGICEVFVSADANLDGATNQMSVCLKAFLRTTDIRTKEKQFSADWLPKSEIITELVSPGEAVEAAREIFHRWVRKVRQAAPALHNSAF